MMALRARSRPAREALAWFVKLHEPNRTTDDALFRAWLAANTENRAEFERLQFIWSDLDAIPASSLTPRPRTPVLSSRRLLVGSGVVAAVVVLAGSGAGFDLPTMFFSDLRTGSGEQRRARLEDGSAIMLDAESAVTVAFQPD